MENKKWRWKEMREGREVEVERDEGGERCRHPAQVY